jgi:dTDP-4-dehydrorhamnose reductase
VSLGIDELDITDLGAVKNVMTQHQPSVVINAAAYTAVDKAESDRDLAFAVNADGAKNLAQACVATGTRLIQISTDFVFDGEKSSPYLTSDFPKPDGVYAESKALGEQHVLNMMPDSAVVIRTAWLYSSMGNNFVKSMLRLMSEKDSLGVIADQVGTPTWAKGLAECVWSVLEKPEVKGMLHWSDAGVGSWYDFAVAIQDIGLEQDLLTKAIPIRPITTADYPTPARRPAYSVLDKTEVWSDLKLPSTHWRHQLKSMMAELKA